MRTKLSHQHGFTLIELLVVISIIGVMSSMLVLSIKTTDTKNSAETWLKQLDEKITYALDAAVLSNKNLAIQFGKDQVRFLIRKKTEWTLYEKEPLKKFKLPSNTVMSLYVGGSNVLINDSQEKVKPNVLIDSLAMMTPFELHIQHSDNKTHIAKYDAVGKVQYSSR